MDKGLRSIAARQSMKTLAFETCEQLGLMKDGYGKWHAPDWYIQAVSGGMGPIGTWRGFEELYEMGLIDRLPKIAVIQVEGCAPMVTAFKAGKDTPDIVANPNTHIATLATGNPGVAYKQLREIILKHGGIMESVSDQESFRAMHVMAKMDGFSVEPATAAAFAGLFKLVGQQVVGRDELVVVNCSGHTFPVEKELLGDVWARDVEVPEPALAASVPQEGLLSALERLDDRMRDILIMEDTPEASRLLRRVLQAHGTFTVREAENGHVGLEMVYQRPPDLILLDLMMPEMDGFAVLDTLKTDKELSKIPVIVVTAKELTAIEKQRLAGKVQSLMQKGAFSDQDIVDKMVEMLN
jgi:threonine synthase